MSDFQSLTHSKWDCKYHVVFIPKYRKQRLFSQVRKYLGPVFHELARHKESTIIEGHMMPDHVHMCIAIPPKLVFDKLHGKRLWTELGYHGHLGSKMYAQDFFLDEAFPLIYVFRNV